MATSIWNYYIEARTRDRGRTDVIVDYRGRQYVIEIKNGFIPRYLCEIVEKTPPPIGSGVMRSF